MCQSPNTNSIYCKNKTLCYPQTPQNLKQNKTKNLTSHTMHQENGGRQGQAAKQCKLCSPARAAITLLQACVPGHQGRPTRSPSSLQSSLFVRLTVQIHSLCSHGCPLGCHGHQYHPHGGTAAVEPAADGRGELRPCPHPPRRCD